MKKYYNIIMLILLTPIAYAIYGGESFIQTLDSCDDNVTVIINGSRIIDEDEYIISLNCSILERGIYNNTYTCNCTDGWVFNLTTKINTINNYNISFVFNYTEEQQAPAPSNPSSGSSGGGVPPKCNEWSKCVNNKTIRLCQKGNSIYNQTKSCVSNTTYIAPVVLPKVENKIEVIQPIEQNNVVNQTLPEELTKTGTNPTFIIVLVLVFLVIIVVGVIMFLNRD